MPSRHQMLLAQQQGDPFLGFLGTALGALGRVAVKGIGALLGRGGAKKVTTAIVTTGASKLARLQGFAGPIALGGIGSAVSARLLSVDSRARKPGVRGALERFLPGGETGFLPARRRMNPTNIHALRRATRRLAAFHKVSTKAERELRKFAPRARRSSAHEHARPVAAVSVR